MRYITLLILVFFSEAVFAQPSNNLINVSARNVWNRMGDKTPQLLSDGSIANNNKIDTAGFVGNSFVDPFRLVFELGDSCYNKIKIQYWHGFGPSSWTVRCYDSNRVLIGTYGFTGVFSTTGTMPGSPDTMSKPCRFIEFQTEPGSDVRELYIYGDKVAKCSPVLPVRPANVKADPGLLQGGSSIDDKDTTYLKRSDGVSIYSSYRLPTAEFYFAYDHTVSNYLLQPFGFNQFGGTIDARKLTFYKSRGIPVQFYINGASLKSIAGLTSANDFSTKSQTNNKKDIPPGSDSTVYGNWANTGRTWKLMSYLYGPNTSATLTPDYVFSGTSPTTAGQNKVAVFEIGNEDNKTWVDMAAYHSTFVMLKKLKMAYDSIKSVSPNAQVFLGALPWADTTWWRSLYFNWYWEYGNTPFPADGFCFNQYLSDAYGGQPKDINSNSAVSPEQFRVKEMITNLRDFMNRTFGNVKLHWTEVGFATSSTSNYDIHAVTGFADSIVQANMMIRTFERAAMVPNGVDQIYSYFHTSDGSGDFGSMYAVIENFEPPPSYAYTGSTRRPLWWWFSTRMNLLKDFKGWTTTITDGDSTGVTVTRYDHKTDPLKKVYYIVRGTYNGTTTSNHVVNVGNAASANLITMAYGQENGTSTPLTITGGNVTVSTVTEGPQYIQVTLNQSVPPGVFRKRGVKFRIR